MEGIFTKVLSSFIRKKHLSLGEMLRSPEPNVITEAVLGLRSFERRSTSLKLPCRPVGTKDNETLRARMHKLGIVLPETKEPD